MEQRTPLIVDTSVKAFFHQLVQEAAHSLEVEAADETLFYLVNLLTSFTSSRSLYDKTADGLTLKPLATLYGEAVGAASADERNRSLKRLGDVALFMSGVFSDSLKRKPVDVDYYIAMGGNAYGYLSGVSRSAARWQAFSEVFDELAVKFTDFVDLLAEVSEHGNLQSDTDILRLYETWLRTGSARAASRLRQAGIEPSIGSVSRHRH